VSTQASVRPNHSRAVRLAFVIGGHVCMVLALFGIILPLMPATVFLLLAAACYARGSKKLHAWLLHHKWFGPPIRDWQQHRAMTMKTKVIALVSLWVGVGVSMFLVRLPWLRLVLGGVVVGVTAIILLIKTRQAVIASQ
jgi:uncharacterized membrane protein YbaN (DUF454 family)